MAEFGFGNMFDFCALREVQVHSLRFSLLVGSFIQDVERYWCSTVSHKVHHLCEGEKNTNQKSFQKKQYNAKSLWTPKTDKM